MKILNDGVNNNDNTQQSQSVNGGNEGNDTTVWGNDTGVGAADSNTDVFDSDEKAEKEEEKQPTFFQKLLDRLRGNEVEQEEEVSEETDLYDADSYTYEHVEMAYTSYNPDETDIKTEIASEEILRIAQSVCPEKENWTDEEIVEAATLSVLTNIADSNEERLMSPDSYGWTGELRNSIAEVLGTDVSYEDIKRVIDVQQDGLEIMKKSLNGDLTRDDLFQYSKEKLSTDSNFGLISDALDYLPEDVVFDWASNGIPDDTEIFLTCRTSDGFSGYTVGRDFPPDFMTGITGITVYNADSDIIYENGNTSGEQSDYTVNEKNEIVYNDTLKPYEMDEESASETVDFKEAYKLTQGREYNEQTIARYFDSAQVMQFAQGVLDSVGTFTQDIQSAESIDELVSVFTDYYGDENIALEQLNIYLEDTIHPKRENFASEEDYLRAVNDIERDLSLGFGNKITGFNVVKNDDDSYSVKRTYEDGTVLEDEADSLANPLKTLPDVCNQDYYYIKFNDYLKDTTGAGLEDYAKEYQDAYLELSVPANELDEYISNYDKAERNAVNVVSGIGTTAAVLVALSLSAETGGTSLALLGSGAGGSSLSFGTSLAIASTAGGTANTLIRGSNSLSAGKEYGFGDVLLDYTSGAIQGSMIPLSAGVYKYAYSAFANAATDFVIANSSSNALVGQLAKMPFTDSAIRICAGTAAGKMTGGLSGAAYAANNYTFYDDNFSLNGLYYAASQGYQYGSFMGGVTSFAGVAVSEIPNIETALQGASSNAAVSSAEQPGVLPVNPAANSSESGLIPINNTPSITSSSGTPAVIISSEAQANAVPAIVSAGSSLPQTVQGTQSNVPAVASNGAAIQQTVAATENSGVVAPKQYTSDQREDFKAGMEAMGASPEEAEMLADFMGEAGVYVDGEVQQAITVRQVDDIMALAGNNPDDVYIMAPQPNGANELKSYTNAARDMIEISDGRLNPENARVNVNFDEMFNGATGDKVIVVSDDCSVSGASIIEDTLNGLSGTLEDGQNVTVVISPTVMGDKAQTAITQFAELYNECLEQQAVTPEMETFLKEVVTDNKEKRYTELINKVDSLVKQEGQIEFRLEEGILAPDYRNTSAYAALSDADKAVVNAWMSAGGNSFGYHNCATTIAITGYEGDASVFASIPADSEAGRALGIGSELPIKGNAPNNNTAAAQVFAKAVGVNPARIKTSGVVSLEDAYYLNSKEMKTGLLMQWDTRNGNDFTGKVTINYQGQNGQNQNMTFKPGQTAVISYDKINPDDPAHPIRVTFEVTIPAKEADKSKRIAATVAQMGTFYDESQGGIPPQNGNDYGFIKGVSNSDKKMGGIQTSVAIAVPQDAIDGSYKIELKE